MSLDDATIKNLIAKAKELGLTRLRVADDEHEICIELPRAARVAPMMSDAPVVQAPAAKDVTSAFVGYFRPSLEAGARVEKDSVVGVVESLGLPNDVLAPAAGTLGGFSVSEGDVVEYGTVIARIDT
ncbi:MAG: biotin/lipoyl-containing protein [Fimbriimonadales bacterium]